MERRRPAGAPYRLGHCPGAFLLPSGHGSGPLHDGGRERDVELDVIRSCVRGAALAAYLAAPHCGEARPVVVERAAAAAAPSPARLPETAPAPPPAPGCPD